MARVICRNLMKRFGDGLAVNNVNLEVGEGEFLVIVGPSGCGKTTTLRMIAGLETISEGEILIDDQVVNDVEPRHRDIAMVFQNYALYPHKKVFDNIAYPLQLRRVARGEIKQRVEETSKLLGIEHLLGRRIRQLSGGERQRVALGRAIVRKPRLFLMDEPLSNLDAQLRIQMRREIIRLQRQLRITTVYVTHDQAEAFVLADQIVLMQAGRIAQIGTPAQLYRSPNSIFTAQFLGLNNIVTGQVVAFEGDLVGVETVLGRLWVLARHEAIPAIHTAINIVIRPEAAQCPDPNRPMRNHITGEVINRSFRGASQRIHLRHISGHVFAFDWVDDGLPSPLSIQLLPEAMSLIG